MGVDVADDRNDGELAVAMGNFSGEMVGYYRLSTAGYFDEQSLVSGLGHPSRSFLTFGTLFLDVENDGWKDLFLLNGHVQDNVEQFYDDTSYRQRALLYRNLRNGHYEEIGGQIGAPFNTRMVGRSAARVDLDGDGRLDLVLTENNGPAHLWRNVTPGGNHWLGVRLEGAESNRDGYGAQVTAIAGGLRQRAELESGSSYLSASDRQLHFGLGSVSRVDRLEVRWPSGRVDHFSNIDADRVVRLREGETSLHPAQPTNSVEGLHTKPAA
jgi:hypothetical protein